ncbi:unnamed protein product [Prunus brigantina]
MHEAYSLDRNGLCGLAYHIESILPQVVGDVENLQVVLEEVVGVHQSESRERRLLVQAAVHEIDHHVREANCLGSIPTDLFALVLAHYALDANFCHAHDHFQSYNSGCDCDQ